MPFWLFRLQVRLKWHTGRLMFWRRVLVTAERRHVERFLSQRYGIPMERD